MSAGARTGGRRVELAVRGTLAGLAPDERARLVDRRAAAGGEVAEAVRDILADVRARGDDALLDMARRWDGVELAALEVPRERWRAALEAMDPAVRSALARAARNLAAFHRAQVPADLELEIEPGVVLERRFAPLGRVGVYAPGGRAAYPSSVLMGVVPARAAGVGEVVVCSPPGPDGRPPPEVLAAAELAGASRVLAVGGAGAVAAMAFGTASVPRCDAVVGPGNRWVAEAKRQVAGDVRTDAPAGPSEVLVVAAAACDPARVAAELVAQAEHDPAAAAVLVTPSAELLEAVEAELARQLAAAPREGVARAALAAAGALLLSDGVDDALDFARDYAPEHLCVWTAHPRDDAARVTTAGTVFLGEASSVVFGDYLTGANHVLPTAGAGRAFGGLSALDLVRSWTLQSVTAGAAGALAADAARLAEAEGLPAHAVAARMRGPG